MKAQEILLNLDSSLAKRKAAAVTILKNQHLLPDLISIIVQNEKEYSLKALMAFEILSREHFRAIQEYTPQLVDAGKFYLDSPSRRYLSKIYGQAIHADDGNANSFNLPSIVKKKIIKLSFLWLISNEQTSVKVFSMQNLFDLRKEEKWISEELKAAREKEFSVSSQGFKPRATKILRKL